MRLTFWAIIAPALLALLSILVSLDHSLMSLAALLSLIWVPWLFVGVNCFWIYWLVRLVKRAWRE